MQTTNKQTRKTLTLVGTMALGLMLAGTVSARGSDDRGDRTHRSIRTRPVAVTTVIHRERPSIRQSVRVEPRYDRRGALINAHLNLAAFVAAVAGDYPLAYALDERGDRIERRLGGYDDRIVTEVRVVDRHSHGHRHHGGCGHRRDGDRGKHYGKHYDKHYDKHSGKHHGKHFRDHNRGHR